MASKYSKTYSRKKVTTNITQFDKLTSDPGKSAHPVAAKTAGHVGKWGVTSFTSLRSINGGYGQEDITSKGRKAEPYELSTTDINSDIIPNNLTNPAQPPKRRKFFKSRDCGGNSEPPGVPPPQTLDNTSPKVFAMDPLGGFDEPSKEVSLNKNKMESKGAISKPCGGIKLKIFKSRNTDFSANEQYSSTIELPSDNSSLESTSSSLTSSPLMVDVPEALMDVELPAECRSSPILIDEVADLPDNTLDSSYEYNGLIDQKSGLPISTSIINENLDLTEGDCSSLISTPLNRANSEPISKLDFDPGFFSSEDASQNNNIRKIGSLDQIKEDIGNYTAQTKSISEDTKIENLQLFGTDFDEEEIVDRTSIDYHSGPASVQTKKNVSNFPKLMEPNLSDCNKSEPNPVIESIGVQKPKESSVAVKKKSIFKSRTNDDSKKRALYKHKWHGHEEKQEDNLSAAHGSKNALTKSENDPFSFNYTPPLTRVQTWPSGTVPKQDYSFEENDAVTRVKCSKEAKKFYTVIKNVKRTHQLQESGEFQEFNDDVEYFLDALKNTNSSSTRCLASFNLAQKCMTPAFRMHLRAHGTVTKFFRVLSDAPSSTQLSDCVALVMFILSQDHLNMDLDKNSLELMLNLLDYDTTVCDNSSQLVEPSNDNLNKIKQLCKDLQQKGYAKHLNLEHINAPTLAMETLLSLTSKRAGEWFKEELRELGGVDHLIRTVTKCSLCILPNVSIWEPYYLEKLSKIDRCLKVLENVTLQNVSNQEYLLKSNGAEFGSTLIKLLQFCNKEIQFYPENSKGEITAVTKALVTYQITAIKVLINLTHGASKEALGSQLLGKHSDIYELSLRCLIVTPVYLGHHNKFEIQVLACCLLLNLTENSKNNRKVIMNCRAPYPDGDSDEIFKRTTERTGMEALVCLFYSSEESAREQEAHTDKIIDQDLDQESKKEDEEIEETVTRLLQKAGRHMEDTLIAAYTALLAGYCLMDNKEYVERIRSMQPDLHFKLMVSVLKKFLHFMNLTATTSLLRSLKPTEKVVKYMERLDRSPAEEEAERKQKEEVKQALAYDDFGF